MRVIVIFLCCPPKVLHHVNGVNTLRVYDKSARGTSLGEIRCQPAAADRRAVGRPRTATVLSSAAMRGLLTHSHSGLRPWASREGIREGMLTVANVLSLCASWSCHTRRRRAPTPPLSDSCRGAAPRAREYDLTRHSPHTRSTRYCISRHISVQQTFGARRAGPSA